MTKISIVIPNWNGAEKLKKHLPKVLEVAKSSGVEEVIVADDASTDNSVKVIKDNFPEVIVVESSHRKNLGFASNVNLGFQHASGDLVVSLNTDASPDKNFLAPILPHFQNPKVFSVGCNVGGLWATGKFENGFFWHGQPHKAGPCEAKAHQTLWASGGSAVFRKEIWDELGGLDPLFDPFYEEDVDLGYRATKRGYINMWEPKSHVEHYKEMGVIAANFSQNTISKTAQRNQLIFIWKNITSDKLITEHQKALAKMLIQHPKYWPTFLAALRKFPQIMAKRKIEKKEDKLTDEEVFSLFA